MLVSALHRNLIQTFFFVVQFEIQFFVFVSIFLFGIEKKKNCYSVFRFCNTFVTIGSGIGCRPATFSRK